jgi:signal transduction histidine kinase
MSAPDMKMVEAKPGGLARFIIVVFSLAIAAFLILGGAFIVTTSRLENLVVRINDDAVRLAAAAEFADALFLFRRDSLLFAVTDDASLHGEARAHLERARALLDAKSDRHTRGGDVVHFLAILTAFSRLEATLNATGVAPSNQIRDDVDRIVEAISAHRAHLLARIEQNETEAIRLNWIVDLTILVLFILLPLVLSYAGLSLWRRIAIPIIGLNTAARRLGEGDLGARAPEGNDDLIGGLIKTFNIMAEDMQGREEDRRHLLHTVVHDLATPITVISGGARLVMKKTDDAEARSWLDRIQVQAERLAAMSGDLLESARIGAGQLQLDLAEVDLAGLVTDAVREERLIRGGRTINLEIESPCVLVCDEKRIGRVLANLISNAIKYSEPPAEVDVKLSAIGPGATISVVDYGTGLTAEEIANLFKPFSRVARTARKKQGTGLGLFSVKKIVEAHGGRIAMDSTPGQGTTVRIELPRRPA